ncbi:MAG TPA: hypothetical protein VG870_11030 [Chitinophagaceae bacterium]|nr:hypothetical protein [Chitinophagaceae bacterium]
MNEVTNRIEVSSEFFENYSKADYSTRIRLVVSLMWPGLEGISFPVKIFSGESFCDVYLYPNTTPELRFFIKPFVFAYSQASFESLTDSLKRRLSLCLSRPEKEDLVAAEINDIRVKVASPDHVYFNIGYSAELRKDYHLEAKFASLHDKNLLTVALLEASRGVACRRLELYLQEKGGMERLLDFSDSPDTLPTGRGGNTGEFLDDDKIADPPKSVEEQNESAADPEVLKLWNELPRKKKQVIQVLMSNSNSRNKDIAENISLKEITVRGYISEIVRHFKAEDKYHVLKILTENGLPGGRY